MLTIKLNQPEDNRLRRSPSRFLFNNNFLSLSSPHHDDKDCSERHTHRWSNDSKGTVTPTPGTVVQKCLSKSRACESVADIWRRSECEENGAILHTTRVCDENVHHVGDAVHTSPVEDLCRGVGLDVLAYSHEDECLRID